MIDEAEKERSEVGATSDWEMDRESFGSEQGSELDSMEEELTHLILKTSSPPNPSVPKPIQHPPVNPPLPNKPGMTLASASSDLAAESTSKPTVTSAIRRGLTEGAKAGLFQYFSQGTREQNKEYHTRETEKSEMIMQDDQHKIAIARLEQQETKRERARIRKQIERERKKRSEIKLGLRSPGGRKRRVSVRSIRK